MTYGSGLRGPLLGQAALPVSLGQTQFDGSRFAPRAELPRGVLSDRRSAARFHINKVLHLRLRQKVSIVAAVDVVSESSQQCVAQNGM
jgi:hypothetical protein